MHFTSITLSFLSLLAFASAAPSELTLREALQSGAMIQYPADHSIDMIKRAHLEARCNVGCPCNWCGTTLCCQCNC
jgi:hypothetical protein